MWRPHGRTHPHRPMVFHSIAQGGVPYTWEEVSGAGLFALPTGDSAGRAGMLIKKSVLDDIGAPQYECGQTFSGMALEDTFFVLKLQRRGYTIWIDRDICLGHITHAVLVGMRDATGVYRPVIASTVDDGYGRVSASD
jgi:hypothetical protein